MSGEIEYGDDYGLQVRNAAMMRQPTAEECSARARVQLIGDVSGWACWYPQIGGYVAMSVVVHPGPTGCSDVYVWHDGEFPFSGQDPSWDGKPWTNPVRLHHCDGGQFVAFGKFLMQLEEEAT